MIDEELARIKALKAAGKHEEAHAEAVALAQAFPNETLAQVAAAYAADRIGAEKEAVMFYDRAYALGPPEEDRLGFLLGYGSTLRNVGRLDQAVEVLQAATREYPQDAALRAFLGLALHSAGRHDQAMYSLLQAALMAARHDGFGPYARALREYLDELAVPDVSGKLSPDSTSSTRDR